MAFQGKGILGGFFGKVGTVVGYKRLGKEIIQKTPANYKNRTWLKWIPQPQVLIDLVNSTVGEYWIENTSEIVSFSNGGHSEKALYTANGQIRFNAEKEEDYGMVSFGNNLTNYSFNNQTISLYSRSNALKVYEGAVLKYTQSFSQAGVAIELNINDGVVSFRYKIPGQEWVIFYTNTVSFSFPLYMIAAPRSVGCRFENLYYTGEKFK